MAPVVLLVSDTAKSLKNVELTNNHDQNTGQDGSPSSKVLADETANNGADKGTDFIDCYDETSQVRSPFTVPIDAERAGEGRAVDEASHKSIVETDQEKSKTCQGSDSSEEGSSLKLDTHIGPMGECVGCWKLLMIDRRA